MNGDTGFMACPGSGNFEIMVESCLYCCHVCCGRSTRLVLDPSFPAINAMDFDIPLAGKGFNEISRAVAFVGANLKNACRTQLVE